MVCKMVNYHKGYKMEFLFNCQLFFSSLPPLTRQAKLWDPRLFLEEELRLILLC